MRPGFAVVLIALLAPPVAADEALTRREKGDLAIRARAILKKHCLECHGGTESRGTVQVLNHSRLVAAGPNPVLFVAPGQDKDSQIIQFIEEGSMPPGDRPRPTEEETRTLKEWVRASAPSYPRAFDDRSTLEAMLTDLDQQAEEAPHLRYFSLAHLIRDDEPLPDLKKVEFDLQRALTWCGVKPPPGKAAAEPVDGTATLFRFDVQHAGWDNRNLFSRSPRSGLTGIYQLTPYDLILLEYPHGFGLAPDDPIAKRLDEYFAAAGITRRVPFLRADWLAEKLAMKSPLADDLRSLGELASALQKAGSPELGKEEKMPCGPATRPFAGKNPAPPAPKAAAVRPILPLSAWYSGDCQANAPSFSLSFVPVDAGGKTLTTMRTDTKYRFKVTTDRRVNFVLLSVFADGDVAIIPTRQGGVLLEAGDHFLSPENSGAFLMTASPTGEAKATEYFVLLASIEKLPAPVVVRSRHSDAPDCREKGFYPLFRFVLDGDAKFDQSRIVRKVVAVTVTDK
jgi:mono/diheme cytochrome c family protein